MFDGVPFKPGVTGCPALVDAAASFDGRLRSTRHGQAADQLLLSVPTVT
jgi:flavin reductase (DIM6/NTAB) family NADH-FMN oxidoreductase RutF